MAVKYSKWPKNTNIFHSKALPNIPKLGFLVWKYTIWQPWSWNSRLKVCVWSGQPPAEPARTLPEKPVSSVTGTFFGNYYIGNKDFWHFVFIPLKKYDCIVAIHIYIYNPLLLNVYNTSKRIYVSIGRYVHT
jgi:hypothetical protein